MLGTIGFDNLHISCIIGALENERTNPQTIFIDIRVEADFSKCVKTDNLNDTINYVKVADLCNEIAQKNTYHLLEAYAAEVVKHLFAQYPLHSAWIRIKKPSGLPNADFTIVELSQKKE